MGRRAKPAKVKAEAKRPLARKAPKQEAPGNHELEKRLAEALEQQAATADILRVLSSSPTDIQPILDAVAESAARLCDAVDVVIRRVDGNVLPMVAHFGSIPALTGVAPAVSRGTFMGHAVLERRTIHLHDVLEPHVREKYPDSLFLKIPGHYRTALCAPLLREDTAIGAIIIRRPEVRPFSDRQIKLLETFAVQAAIAIENTRLFNETKEALEQQTATAEILRVISSSPTDIQPVLDAVAESAARLCGASDVLIRRVDGNSARLVAHFGPVPVHPYAEAVPVVAGNFSGRAILERRTNHIHDAQDAQIAEEYPDVRLLRAPGERFRTILIAPLLREDTAIGVIIIRRPEVRPFSDKQIKLLETFAAQAVIAIENVRLFNETKEALERQTATAEILKVISSSPTDVQPVLDTVAERSNLLCRAEGSRVWLAHGGQLHPMASYGTVYGSDSQGEVLPLRTTSPVGRAFLERRCVHVEDIVPLVETEYPDTREIQARYGFRTVLTVPMLRKGESVGVIALLRFQMRPFTPAEISLVQTFADQAVIAIENVRLFKETKEALEQQTATAEILRAISSSPTDLQPIFDTIVGNAMRLCDAHRGSLRVFEGDFARLVAEQGVPAAFSEWRRKRVEAPSPSSALGELVATKNVVHIPDLAAWRGYAEGEPVTVASVELGGTRTFLSVPMLKEGTLTGAIILHRPEVRPFTDKQIALLKTFADQAVIAIENVRLFKELEARNKDLRESLEQQTVTSEILKIISSSPTDVQPVFDAIVKSGVRLFSGLDMQLRLVKGDQTEMVASTISLPGVPIPPPVPLNDERSANSRSILRREVVQVPDVFASDWISESVKRRAEQRGFRALMCAPMLRENNAIGTIIVNRATPGPFTEKQIALLRTFADQAVIAIENVRLFNETKEALEQQTVISEILRVISSSPTEVQPVFDAIVKSGVHLFGGLNVSLLLVKGDQVERVASTIPFDADDVLRFPLNDDRFFSSRAIMGREVVQVSDLFAENRVSEGTKRRAEREGFRALLSAPMLRENNAIGAITVSRATSGPFTEKEIALLKTFADQAVIAIENVRLFKELQARNAEITESLEQQTATADILSVISSSPTDLQPVFDAILEKAIRLCDAHMGHLGLYDGEKYQNVALRGANAEYAKFLNERGSFRPTPGGGGAVSRMIAERQPIQIADRGDSPEYRDGLPGAVALVELGGGRTYIAVPMLKEGCVVGGIAIYRPEVRPFTQKQIDLVSTFANQAVIAIENVRLFKEINEALQRQTSIAEILRVISSNPTDVMPVLEAVTHRAAQLCDAPDARLFLVDGDTLRYVTGFGELKGVVETLPLTRGIVVGRAIIDRSVMHIEDLAAALDEFPDARGPQRLFGHRTTLAVPLVRENKAFGGILMRRKEVRPFSEKQIELVKTFADQAVIAIHNVRLFKEINEALEQQTATSEVLKVISRSTFDLGPVLETLVDNARKLCSADRATISRADKDGNYTPVVERALDPSPEYLAYMQRHPIRPDRGSAVGRAVLERRPVHIPDILADPEYKRLDLADIRSFRTILAVPMLREGEPIGVFVLTRHKEVKPFTEKQVELVTTFADQAVIAIENVRLFNEIQDKSRQLEVASRHKSQFLANMSHELRTPLNAILGYTELILDGIYGDVSAKVSDVMGRVDKSGRHLLGLINDVLDLSKIEAGQLTLSLADYSLTDVVQTVFTSVGSLAAEKKLALKLALASDLPRGRGDDRRLAQVLLNLVGNAIKFTEAGEVRLEARCSDGAFVVSVADTGPGISEADQQRIFEEFQQVDDSATRKKGGTGLGLSIAKRIIELHGGRIQVESAPGRGSTFTVTLPVRVERQASPL